MSGEKTPILSGAIPAFETFMSSWEKLGKEHRRLKPLIKPGLDWACIMVGWIAQRHILSQCVSNQLDSSKSSIANNCI